MNGEELYEAIGEVPERLILEAANPAGVKKAPFRHWKGLIAAALAAAVGVGAWQVLGGGPLPPPGAMAGGSGHPGDSSVFMSYGGPVFPLTLEGGAQGLEAERELTYDFGGWSRRATDLAVTDGYTLYNDGPEDRTVRLIYPYAGTLTDPLPTLTLDGAPLDTALAAGHYAGCFTGAGSGPLNSVNLSHPSSWEDYAALLDGGGYQAAAFAPAPVLDQSVTVYEFHDYAADYEGAPAATLAMSFDMDYSKTSILTYGFNGAEWDEERGFRRCSFFIPGPADPSPYAGQPRLVVVVGEDIGDYEIQGYVNGGCEEELDGVAARVERYPSTLGQVVDRLARWEVERGDSGLFLSNGLSSAEEMPYELYYRAVCQLLADYGPLGGDRKDRYDDGRLDDILSEAAVMERVLYLAAEVTVPAGGSVRVEARLRQRASFDFACAGGENQGIYGYDAVTRLGSWLSFGRQTARILHGENVEIVRQNYGFDVAGGVTRVELDPEVGRYYLEVRGVE